MKRRKKPPNYLKRWKAKNRPQSSLEVAFEEILKEVGIPYVREWRTKYKRGFKYFDFLIFENNEYGEVSWRAVFETHGDFFHSWNYHCGKKTKSELFKIQRKNLRNDATKKRILKELQIPLFVYWEHQVHEQRELVKNNLLKIIQEFRSRIENRETLVLSESEIRELDVM